MTFDAAGNMVATGEVVRSVTFGSTTLTVPSSVSEMPFIAKFASDCTPLWAKLVPGAGGTRERRWAYL
jgi:hypothetical protein